MFGRCFTNGHRSASWALAALMGTALTGCVTAEEMRYANLQKDRETCADFGADGRSSAYTDCMLVQQRRRDTERLDALERQRLTSEIARNSMEMSERVRCERDAKRDREEGRRPRPCR